MKFNGNIISELSDKIPTYLVAFNELTKNSYDACANMVKIKLDSKRHMIEIIDDGNGMSSSDIGTLFHISKSTKTYGELHSCNKNGQLIERYRQGSKGLGFLSVFKFGQIVKWTTIYDNIKRTFSANYVDLLSQQDLSHYEIDIEEEVITSFEKGTIIEIWSSGDLFNDILKYLDDQKNLKKILNAFLDHSISISYELDGKIIAETNINPNPKANLLYHVKYDSSKQNIDFHYNSKLIFSKGYSISDTRYSVKLDLYIYDFGTDKSGKSKIDDVFKVGNKLTPLIFINNNYFDNVDLFDPEINRKTKNTMSLPQMTGYVMIYSNDKLMGFNSDRTNFIQNNLTDTIKETLEDLNSEIQKLGSQKKKYLRDLDFLNRTFLDKVIDDITDEEIKANIKDDFAFKSDVVITKDINNKVIIYDVFDKSKKCTTLWRTNMTEITAFIELTTKKDRILTNSNQINLIDYIRRAINSKNEDVKKNVTIYLNSLPLEPKILPSQTSAQIITLIYEYIDSKTGATRETLQLEFYDPVNSIQGINGKEYLIQIPGSATYVFNYSNHLTRLIGQLNTLGEKLDDNIEIIAVAMRSIFDISITLIISHSKIPGFVKSSNHLKVNTGKVIEWAIGKKEDLALYTSIKKDTLSNLLICSDFENCISKTNLGAHQLSTYLSAEEIKTIAKKASLFIVLTNEIINHF